ncbi:MAG: TonB-dependent receptor [Chitinophagaceae bacterium]|nr:MAG: TonB-dependent receptor [Chitinophagaceae bacterium]
MHFKKIIPMVIAMLALPFFMMAQVTTSSISGVVKDKAGNPLTGSSITATHTPTGTVYTSVARTGGRFDINNMNPGGPYVISSTFVGFETSTKQDVFLTLGEISRVDFEMSDKSTELTTVTVSGTRTGAKAGNETQIGRDKLNVLPTVGRNLNDYIRFTPQTKITSTGGISIAGQNNRYNGFLIDGAVNNDVFGLSDQGTNGGRAGTPPISIDAVDQIVVQLSPYDAALGNFTGGAINAITKSGTNTLHGSAYYIFRNQNMAGKTPGDVPDSLRKKLSDFKNQTYGFTIGGPIVKSKAFFFVNAEMQKDSRPQPYTPNNVLNPDGSIRYNIVDSVNKLQNYLRTKYGYETGDFLNNPDDIDRININTRFDVNLNTQNKLTLSYRYTNAERTNPGRSTNNSINFTNGAEFFPSVTHSGNAELNTKFSNKMNNKFRVSFTNVVDDRGPTGDPFPAVSLQSFNGGPSINFGTEAASSANLLKQTIINFYDAFKYYTGRHALTVGADVDFNKSYNLFMNRAFSLYGYNNLGAAGPNQIGSLQAFMEDRGAQRIRRGYSLVDDNSKGGDLATNAAANFKSVRLGFFLNDDIKVSDKFTLTLGLRADRSAFTTEAPEDVFFNDTARAVIAGVYDLEGAVSGGKFQPKWQFSPRVGFKVNLDDEGVVIRGGVGIFGGRTPLVWPGGVYQNNGVTIGALDVAGANGTSPVLLGGNPVPFRADVNNQYTQADFGLAPSLIKPQGDMNIIAKNFHLPTVLRGSVGADKKLGRGWSLNFDLMYTKNIYEVDWVNVNFQPPAVTTTGPDARLVYSTTGSPTKLVYRPAGTTAAARNPYANVILLRNSTGKKGFSYNFTTGIEKQTKNGLIFNASYTYGNSQVRNEATSSVNTSNWLNMEAVSSRNYIGLATSDFDMGHRIFALLSKKFTYLAGKMATTVSFVYNGQSGSPYSYTMSGNGFIGDGGTNNDLMYIPRSRAEMDQMSFPTNGALTETIQKDQFEAFIQSDKYLSKHRGQFAERNGARAPFTNIVDANVQQDFSVNVSGVKHTLSVRLDIFNLTNLIDKNAGRQYFFNFDQAQVLQVVSFTGTKPNYRFNRPANDRVGAISDGISAFNSSRWNGQATIRYSF